MPQPACRCCSLPVDNRIPWVRRRFDCTRNALIREGSALPRLMQLLLDESSSRALQGLRILNECVKTRHNEEGLQQLTVQAHALPVLCKFLGPEQPLEFHEQAAQLLAVLASTQQEAKLEAVQCGCVPPLVQLLRSSQLSVATAAATALMNLTLANEGKYAVLEADGIGAVVELTDLRDETLCLQMLQLITNLAEAPECRAQMQEQGILERLEEIQTVTPHDLISRSASQALRQCGFKHRPFEPLPGIMYNAS